MWTITLCGGRDQLPVMVTYSTKARAQRALPAIRKSWRGYQAVVHRLGAKPKCRRAR